MTFIDAIKIIKYELGEEFYVFLAKEGNRFYVWSSDQDWENQNFENVRLCSNQSKNLQTALDVFNFFRYSFESVEDYNDEEGKEFK